MTDWIVALDPFDADYCRFRIWRQDHDGWIAEWKFSIDLSGPSRMPTRSGFSCWHPIYQDLSIQKIREMMSPVPPNIVPEEVNKAVEKHASAQLMAVR